MPQCSDLFGRKGLIALNKLVLSEPDATLLREELGLLELIQDQIKAQEARIVEFNSNDESTLRLQSIPGMGKILAAVAAAEIDCVERFSSGAKLCAYAGLVPRTHASGGKVYQGHLLKSRNKWLQWAFIEAAWVAVGARPTSAVFTASIAPEARMPTWPSPSSPGACVRLAGQCSKKGEILLKLSPIAPQLD